MSYTTIKYYLADNESILKDTKASIDNLAIERRAENEQNNREFERVRDSGMYSDGYLKDWYKNQVDKKPYRESFNRICALRKPRVARNNEMIGKCLERYFGAPLNMELANKITSFEQLGVELSTKELETLEKSATSYADRKLLERYFEKNKKAYTQVPSYELIMQEYNNYSQSALNVFNYGGQDGELYPYIDKWSSNKNDVGLTITPFNSGLGKALCSGADAFIKDNETERFINFLDKTGINLHIETLSDDELELIESYIESEKNPYLIEFNVKHTAEENPVLKDLLLRHQEYRQYLL